MPAHAQQDIRPRLPNVLLLVDNSGSMEFLLDPAGKLPGAVSSSSCDGTKNLDSRNRWATLVTALTGSIADSDFACRAVQRNTATFKEEYGLSGIDPYDASYFLPFHRIYSGDCAYGAGEVKATWNWWDLPSQAGGKDFTYRDASGAVVSSCNFVQAPDGLLDAFRTLVRFGMMSTDSFPSPSTGSNIAPTPNSALADYSGGTKGMWSYYHNWTTTVPATPSTSGNPSADRPAAGMPSGCPTPSFMEVGARNQAAPPWEGRLVPFGDPDSDAAVVTTNDRIQMQLLTMRPYGATPLAGLLDDAEEFIFKDTTTTPAGGSFGPSGPKGDLAWQQGCRKTFVILLSDGSGNLDLRSPGNRDCVGGMCQGSGTACTKNSDCAITGCDSSGSPNGVCPYSAPEETAKRMWNQPDATKVATFVVGFTLSDFNKMSPKPSVPSGAQACEALDVTTSTDCSNPPAELRACCTLQKIAVAGGTKRAYFADTQNKLKQAIAEILSQIVSGSTARTWPVYAPAGNRQAQGTNFSSKPTASYQFTASFDVNSPPATSSGNGVTSVVPSLWNGRLIRQRTSCPGTGIPTTQAIEADNGDDYAENLNRADSANPRLFFTAIGNKTNNKINSDYTVRPFIVDDDGLGTYATQSTAPKTPADGATFASQMSAYPEAFGLPANSGCHAAFGATVGTAQCTQYLVNYEVGITNPLPSTLPQLTRDWKTCPITCASPTNCRCSQFGAIFHSTPVVVGPPREYLRDDSYAAYQNNAVVANQPSVLYTATMDGQLHAFKVQANKTTDTNTTDKKINNEMWSFFPPAVLKHLMPNYNIGGVALLDGAPVIADVPGAEYTSIQTPQLARAGTTMPSWHRVLVAGGGSAGGFYYALEITDPTNPRFLWQLSTDDRGNPLFGSTTPTPAIAIANVKLDSGGVQQVPIAILPGGNTGAIATKCNKKDTKTSPIGQTYSNVLLNDANNPHLLSGITAAPPDVQCWSKTKNANRSSGNSLVIARLDTGKVLAYFVGKGYSGAPKVGDGGDDGDGGDNDDKHAGFSNAYNAPFQAPLSGVPVAYPGQTGQVSDRVYIGDADGLLWRLDMSDPNLANWKVELAWDAYVDDKTPPTGTNTIREGISIPPIISRDAIGNPVILLATGEQDSFSVQQTANHVWSLSEHPLTRKVSPNWHIKLPKSTARVTGPMSLFNGALYFTTFLPVTGSACSDGYSSVWAVDFLRRGAGSQVPAGLTAVNGEWPLPLFPTNTPGTYIYGLDGDKKTIIMGVSVGETPTCDASTTINDPYFGSHTALSNVSGSSYQVTWQTGAGTGLNATNTGVKNSNVNGVQSITATSPGQGSRIDSWASIVE
ncbi:Type IV fimbrial biogenesis protein PilY1 [Minicystis rosea]|nr:Type IV fimbrial biogenesis protein PilY1 [Minicystis rosea]